MKGTPSRGKHMKTRVIRCRRCGRRSYHVRKSRCSACGFGTETRIRAYKWMRKPLTRVHRLV